MSGIERSMTNKPANIALTDSKHIPVLSSLTQTIGHISEPLKQAHLDSKMNSVAYTVFKAAEDTIPGIIGKTLLGMLADTGETASRKISDIEQHFDPLPTAPISKKTRER